MFGNRRISEAAAGDDAAASQSGQADVLDPAEFKSVFSRLASSISVITFDVDGHLHGFTATSLTPVSLEPPMALFCVGNKNQSHAHLKSGLAVGLSILASGQTELSARFAGKAEPGGYADVPTITLPCGASILDGAVAGIGGVIDELVPVGDHTIYLCKLIASRVDPATEPLLYYARDYRFVARSG
jgi:flavin reductase (DIM6/NTAB) family NADH-FMN oxidoreductase RutF